MPKIKCQCNRHKGLISIHTHKTYENCTFSSIEQRLNPIKKHTPTHENYTFHH